MTFPFVGPVEVPAPTSAAHPTTKTYVDTEVGTRALTTHNHDGSYATTGHNHDASYSATGHTHTHPLVPNAPLALTYAASLTPDASQGNYRVVTATGDVTLNAPTSPTDGQLLRIRFIASSAQRTVTFNAALKRPTAIASTLVIPSGLRGDVGLVYETADGWTVLAAQAQA